MTRIRWRCYCNGRGPECCETQQGYMDDVIVLAPTRHKLRRAVKIVNETLAELWLEKAPNKTFIGRVERGFGLVGLAARRKHLK
jgi:hypothetical protein